MNFDSQKNNNCDLFLHNFPLFKSLGSDKLEIFQRFSLLRGLFSQQEEEKDFQDNFKKVRTGGKQNNLPPFGANYLTRYIDLVLGKHQRVFLFQKRYSSNLSSFIPLTNPIPLSHRISEKTIWKIILQVLYALRHLNCFHEGNISVVHGNISPECIFLIGNAYFSGGNDFLIKVGDYALNYLSKNGSLASFPIGHPNYIAPELIVMKQEFQDQISPHPNLDTWSLGIIILELLEGKRLYDSNSTPSSIFEKVLESLGHQVKTNNSNNYLSFKDFMPIHQQKESFNHWLEQKLSSLFTFSPQILEFVRICLNIDPTERPTPSELLSWIELQNLNLDFQTPFQDVAWIPKYSLNSLYLDFKFLDDQAIPQNLLMEDINLDNIGKSLIKATNPISENNYNNNSPKSERNFTTRDWLYKEISKEEIIQKFQNCKKNAFLVKPGRPASELFMYVPNKNSFVRTLIYFKNPSGFCIDKTNIFYPSLETLVQKAPELSGFTPIKLALQEELENSKNSNLPSNLVELYQLFKSLSTNPLSDTTFEKELSKLVPEAKLPPAIRRLPSSIVTLSSDKFSENTTTPNDSTSLFSCLPIKLSEFRLKNLIQILQQRTKSNSENPSAYADVDLTNRIPLHVRVKDLSYQRNRIVLFRNLFSNYPSSRLEIIKQAKIDIPPYFRGLIWAAILHCPSNTNQTYEKIDIKKKGISDHQIDVDIPRCHQYHPLLNSSQGHSKMRRILKAWVEFNTGRLVYWQGLDHILAPFLVLFFEYESVAWYCFQTFIEKFLHNMFLKDNHLHLQEHLQIFRKLLCYHEPALAVHLDQIEFYPSLYAVPWFLTLFTHTLKLDKIMQMWDSILVNSETLHQYMAISIMRQFRTTMLKLDFNGCVSFFANKDLPIDVHRVSEEALAMYHSTPINMAFMNKFSDSSNQDFFAKPEEKENDDPHAPLTESGLSIPQMTGKEYQSATEKYVVKTFDIRPLEEYKKTHLSNSINIKDWKKIDISRLSADKGHYISIMGPNENDSTQFGLRLLNAGWPYISILKLKSKEK